MPADGGPLAGAPPTARRLVVFGATGGAGRAIVREAHARGATVTAFGRDAARTGAAFADLDARAGGALRVVAGDYGDASAVDAAVAGQDAVLVAVGPRKGDDPHALTTGLEHVLAAMHRHAVPRVLVMLGMGIRVAGDRKPLPDRLLSAVLRRAFRADIEAKEAQLERLRATSLDWTAVRPPRLVDRPGTGRALRADPHEIRGGRMVPYADLARWMLDEVDTRRWVRQAVFVTAG